ncbi:MAG: hypothetical protein ACREBB_04990 [Nitrosotalea sp.]
MKILHLSIIFLIGIGCSTVQACVYCPASPTSVQHQLVLQQALNQKLQETLKQQIQQSQDQHAQDLQIISLLISISIGLGCALMALVVIFLKNKSSGSKVT